MQDHDEFRITGGDAAPEAPASAANVAAPEAAETGSAAAPLTSSAAAADASATAADAAAPAAAVPQDVSAPAPADGPVSQEPAAAEEPAAPAFGAVGQQAAPAAGQPAASYPYGGAYPYGGSYPYGASDGQGQPGVPNPYAGSYRQPDPNGAYAYPNTAPPKKRSVGAVVFVVCAAVMLACVCIAIAVGVVKRVGGVKSSDEASAGIDNVGEIVTAPSPEEPAAVSAEGVMSPNAIYKKVLPSSVGILVYSSGKKQLASEGSGVLFKEDNDGKYTYIITCAHVISDRGVTIMVQLHNEKEYAAQVVGYDNKTDIGVLRIEASGLTCAEIGDSSKLSVGDTVYAIGNPGGTEFANSFTAGMISAIDRPVSSSSTGYTMECIQHTAAINPGNSGGALVNSYGQVIGINSMKIVADDYEGMGFSVPSSVFVKIVNEIVANGYVTNRPKIGITYVPASSEQAYAMFVAIKGLPSGSIIVYSIASDSSLANTDLKKGDLIVGVNGDDLKSASQLAEMVEKGKVGDTLTLNVVRINSDYTFKEFDVKATLVEDKGDTTLTEEETTTSYFDDYFGNRDGYGSDDDFFNDFFGDFFGNP